ncbi:GNAT family N-acetyltransferase [Rhizobium sp. SL86]|uniref:GNAT family N-acetyltransferase n=1 Tax=Rhizobium sp. SL86 TaxID=2995148 RepID=UPI002276CFF0|nr:GNAT family N-acetyltransferase [Rhizobium sp. SL86]MCY1668184.1 GNAT family N-acetyltransferase [Rhizobium sp. SL86]
MAYDLTVTDAITPEDEKAIEAPLVAYNIATFGKSDKRDLSIPLRNAEGNVEGGLVGYTARGWLYVRLLFIPEAMRGQGLAPRLLQLAEDEAKRRGCIGAYLDTMNPQALKIYQRCGYALIGQHGPLTGDMTISWLHKRFETGDAR